MTAARDALRFTRVIVEDRGRFAVLYEQRDVGCEWNFPGGKVAPGEDPTAAARRELREELTIEAVSLRPVLEGDFIYRGRPWYGYYFHTRDWRGDIRIGEPHKTLELACLTPAEMLDRGLPTHFLLDPLQRMLRGAL